MIEFILGFMLGVTVLLGYLVKRMLGSDGWDSSNITNALRLLAHVAMHPQDFVHMWYARELWKEEGKVLEVTRRAFPYLGQDELSDVVKTRPKKQERI